jgi:carboxypeptidase family protein/TonB-dependent receptor-like protein
MKRALGFVLGGLFITVLSCSLVWAQATAQISGTARDQSGAVLPGVEIHVTQTETGVVRDAVTNETGSYVLTNLPIGPYRLEGALPGFRTYAQSGIVLQVNSSPTVNVVLEVGQVSETVEVQANAALVETRTAGIGAVVENTRILELPLNGRAMIELVALSGAATPAPIVNASGGRDPFSKGNLSVAGGLNTGLNYTLDGAYHNNPYDNGYMSMPFPDALQEFKVETGATGVQTGVKSSGSVSLVTKSGTNEFHGDLFEFVRNGKFNARNAFATRRDSIKRNQFGGTVGAPIIKNKLFFFAGYQGTTLRQDPADQPSVVPTAAMLAGDFTAFASPACNGGRPITLRAPFANNRIDPAQFSKPAVRLASKLPPALDACGNTKFGVPSRENDHMTLGRIDYQRSASHSIFGRYLLDSVKSPPPYDIGHNVLNSLGTGNTGLAQAFTLGDTYLFGANIVNAFRFTANRIAAAKTHADYDSAGLGPGDIGIKAFLYEPHRPIGSVSGGFAFNSTGGPASGSTRGAIFGANDDLSLLRGNHQLTFGSQMTLWWTNSYSNNYSTMTSTFNGQAYGLGMADFFMGSVASFGMGTYSDQNKKSRYFGLYGGDTWKLNQKLTLNYGVRWEPYFPMVHLDKSVFHFDADALAKGIKSNRFSTTPAGMLFAGDPGFPGLSGQYNKWWNFSPRAGLAWDVSGDGRTSVRASAGTFYDFPATIYMQGFGNGPPFTPRFVRQGVNFENPWATEPGGDPFPLRYGKGLGKDDAIWPQYALILTTDYDTPNMQVVQWNLSLQKQVGTDWLVSASYLGNETSHLWTSKYINPAVYLGLGPCTLGGVQYASCSTTNTTNQRRRLSLANPVTGQNFGIIQKVDAGGTASYNGLLLSVQRRAARGITLSGNYTLSHCISDPGGAERAATSGVEAYSDPDNRRFDRGNCTIAGTDRRHVFNLSAVANTPQFSNRTLRVIASGWRLSPIFRILSGDYLSIISGQDRALTGSGNQRVNQVLANPYGDKTVGNYLNPAAFAQPALGTLGSIGAGSIHGPGYWQFDTALSRTFQLKESQKLEFRAEAFNVTNSFRMEDPTVAFNSGLFGQVTTAKDPRIMQFALKYVF